MVRGVGQSQDEWIYGSRGDGTTARKRRQPGRILPEGGRWGQEGRTHRVLRA